MRIIIIACTLVVLVSAGIVEAGNGFAKAHDDSKPAMTITLDPRILANADLDQVVKKGEGRFDCALAMNVWAGQMPQLRELIGGVIGRPLTFFKQWQPDGEAHVTVITPVEFYDVLRGPDAQHPILTMDQIGAIARQHKLQQSSLEIVSMGSGKKLLDGKLEETFFLIVKAEPLFAVRRAIHEAFVTNGGRADAWDPNHFYPHITVGYTLRDLHEADGVVKDVANSCDSRFEVQMGK